MNSKSIVNNLNQSNLAIDFFENDAENIICYCFKNEDKESEGYDLKHITMAEFEAWLSEKNYLKGSTEECIGSNHDGDPIYKNIDWAFTIEEFLKAEYHDWTITDLLTEFLNNKTN